MKNEYQVYKTERLINKIMEAYAETGILIDDQKIIEATKAVQLNLVQAFKNAEELLKILKGEQTNEIRNPRQQPILRRSADKARSNRNRKIRIHTRNRRSAF